MNTGSHPNYGLAGGMLDATEHLLKAEKAMCYPSEISKRQLAEARMAGIQGSSPDLAQMPERN